MIDFFGIVTVNGAYIVIALVILLIVCFAMIITILCKLKKLTKRYEEFMGGRDGRTMEELIKSKLNEIEDIKLKSFKNGKDIAELYEKMEKTICKVGLVKYDAFNEMGGKLSFALVLLNEHNTGLSMNSMHGPEGSYVYVKEIINGQSYIALGDEEQKALDMALDKNN
ncbi:MAG: DUF4446 family protein [Thermoflexaceae bacterium]|nr:DUF4446 family protein [Thermoflexaceae bacterium]